jgi:hypothetical protein
MTKMGARKTKALQKKWRQPTSQSRRTGGAAGNIFQGIDFFDRIGLDKRTTII